MVNDPLKTSPAKPKVLNKTRKEKKIVKAKPQSKSMNRVQKNRPQQKPKIVVQKVIEKIVYVNEKGQKVAPPKSASQQKSQAVVSRTRTQRRRDSRAKLANQKSTLTKVTSAQGEISVVTDLRKQIDVRKKQHGTFEKNKIQKKPAQTKQQKNKPKEEAKKPIRKQKKQVLKSKKKQIKEEAADTDDDYEQVSRSLKTTQRRKRERVQLEESSNGSLSDKGLKRWKNDQFIDDARNKIPSKEHDISKNLISTKFGIKK